MKTKFNGEIVKVEGCPGDGDVYMNIAGRSQWASVFMTPKQARKLAVKLLVASVEAEVVYDG